MGILWVREHWEGRQASVDTRGHNTFRLTFIVRTTTMRTGAKEVGNALGIPRIWSTYATPTESNPFAVCIKVDPQQTDDPQTWKVVCDYTTDWREFLKGSVFSRPPKVTWDTEELREGMQEDWDGKAVVNSAGDPFETQEWLRGIDVLTVERNVPVLNYLQLNEYRFSVNSAPWYQFEVGTVLFANYSATQEVEKDSTGNDIYYWRLKQVMKIDKKGWQLRLLDRGFRAYRDDDPLKENGLEIITDRNGVPVSREALLNGEGFKLAFGPPFYIEYKRFPFLDLNVILPESILPPFIAGDPGW